MRDLISHFEDATRLLSEPDPTTQIDHRTIEERDNQYGGLALSLSYSDNSTLHVRLWVDCSGEYPRWISYSFQHQGAHDELRFRYDDARHHPELPNFPHHLHLGPDNEALPFGPPSLRDVATAIQWHLEHPEERWQPTQ